MTAYTRWTAEVDRRVEEVLGAPTIDLPDLTDLGALYASEVTPADAAKTVIFDQTGSTDGKTSLDDLPGVQGYYPY